MAERISLFDWEICILISRHFPFCEDDIEGLFKKLNKNWSDTIFTLRWATALGVDPYSPIRLTPEILAIFGFKNKGVFTNKIMLPGSPSGDMDGSILFELDMTNVYFDDGKFYYELSCHSDNYGFNYTTKEISFLHELFNLHLLIEEKELTAS